MLPYLRIILLRTSVGAGVIAGVLGFSATAAERQQIFLAARAVLGVALRTGSPPSGAFLTPEERATAHGNGVPGPASGPYLPAQPIQGVSSMVPADGGTWWALADNGYGARGNSADFQLVIHRIDPRWNDPRGPQVLDSIVLRDPDRRVPWTIVCDPMTGSRLPDFSFNVLPASPPQACGPAASSRILTGFDFDPESFARAPDGTFWISDEFGPFLLHAAADGRVLEAPISVPLVRSPQNPFLNIGDRTRPERPNLAASRGFEGMAISPDGARLYALLEGAVAGDDPQDLRIYIYEIAKRAFAGDFLKLRLEMPSQLVNLAGLNDSSGARVYPDATAPAGGPVSIGELKAVNDRHLLLIERDNHGDDLTPPRFKKIFLLDLGRARQQDGYLSKTLLVDLLAVPDPSKAGGDGDFFQMPFYTIESVHVVDERTLLVASDNNFPFSNGRARSHSKDRSGPLAVDTTELVLVRLGIPLEVDRRLLPPAR